MNLLGKNNKNSNLNYIFFGCIIILLILYVFNLEKDNNLKVTTIKHKDIIENFITPTKLNTPLYFELYKIDKTNKNLSCIFNEPYNNIIANRVVLTGGVSQMDGLLDFTSKIVDKKARIAKAKVITGLPENMRNPSFSAISSLLNYSITNKNDISIDLSKKTNNTNSLYANIEKFKNWIIENF